MSMEFTKQEAINLIINFYIAPVGYWKDEIDEYPEVRRFVDADFASLDEEYGDKYVINDFGRAALHPYIQDISLDYLNFMKDKQYDCPVDEAIHWFIKKYDLHDETARELCEYIFFNLKSCGYETDRPYKTSTGYRYLIKRTDSK